MRRYSDYDLLVTYNSAYDHTSYYWDASSYGYYPSSSERFYPDRYYTRGSRW